MKSYNKFLELYTLSALSDTPTSTVKLSDDDLLDSIKTNCKDFSFDDEPIFRSVNLEENEYYINPDIPFGKYYEHEGRKLRKSAYADNYYTLLINHLPCWSEFPKRQVICANYDKAYGKLYRIIPFDNTKIGMTPKNDIQTDEKYCDFYRNYQMYFWGLNLYYKSFNCVDTDWKSFNKSLETICNFYPEIKHKELFEIDSLNDILTPKNTLCKLYDYNDYKHLDLGMKDGYGKGQRELWIDKEHLLIRNNYVPMFRKKFNI